MHEPEFLGDTVQEMMSYYLTATMMSHSENYSNWWRFFRHKQERYDELSKAECRGLQGFGRVGKYCGSLACPSCWYRTQSRLLSRFVEMDYPYYVWRYLDTIPLDEEISETAYKRVTKPRRWNLGFYMRYVTVIGGTKHGICSLSGIDDPSQFRDTGKVAKQYKEMGVVDELLTSKDEALRVWTQDCVPPFLNLDIDETNGDYELVIEKFKDSPRWARTGRAEKCS